jgi:hypothetical protein
MFSSISLFSFCDIDTVVNASYFTPANLCEMTFYHMVEAQKLTPTHAINRAFVHNLPEAKRVPLLAILTRTYIEDLSHFRNQGVYLQEALAKYPRTSSTTVILPEPFSSKVGLIEFQINQLHAQVRRNGGPRLLTLEADLTIKKLVNDGFQTHSPVSMFSMSDQIIASLGFGFPRIPNPT